MMTMTLTTKADHIRDSYRDLDPAASSKDIAEHCFLKHGCKPSPQNVYYTCGSEADRIISSFNGGQLLDVRRIAQRQFDGDYSKLMHCVQAASRYDRRTI